MIMPNFWDWVGDTYTRTELIHLSREAKTAGETLVNKPTRGEVPHFE